MKEANEEKKFNLDCYYCIYEENCKEAHTWNTGEKDCKAFRGA